MTVASRKPARPVLTPPPYHTIADKARFVGRQAWATLLSSIFLILVVIWALIARMVERFAGSWDLAGILGMIPPPTPTHSRSASPSPDSRPIKGESQSHPWEEPERWKDEKLVKDVRYYARTCGFEIINETVTTADGYHLLVNRVVDPTRVHVRHADGKGMF